MVIIVKLVASVGDARSLAEKGKLFYVMMAVEERLIKILLFWW